MDRPAELVTQSLQYQSKEIWTQEEKIGYFLLF